VCEGERKRVRVEAYSDVEFNLALCASSFPLLLARFASSP
jgi:hypothetical protein